MAAVFGFAFNVLFDSVPVGQACAITLKKSLVFDPLTYDFVLQDVCSVELASFCEAF